MERKGLFRQEEKWCGSSESGLYGQLFVPERADRGEKVPVILFCHELYRTHESGIPYGQVLASEGFALYTFDCRGASEESRSPGSMLHMSVMSCAEDLMEVYREALTWPFTDPDRIILMGQVRERSALRSPPRGIPGCLRQSFSCTELMSYSTMSEICSRTKRVCRTPLITGAGA